MKVQIVFTIFMAMLETFLYLGSVFGWTSLQPMLVNEGFFSDGCNSKSNGTANGTTTTTNATLTTTPGACTSQIESLSLVFSIVTAVPSVLFVGYGVLLDRYGNWICRTALLILFIFGSLMTALATPEASWILYLSFAFCNFGGVSLLMNNLTVANLLPKRRVLVTTMISGAFDSSSIVYLVFYMLYYSFNLSFRVIFIAHAASAVVFVVQTFFLQPMRTPPYDLPKDYQYGYKELPCFAETKAEDVNLEDMNEKFIDGNNNGKKQREAIADSENPDNDTLKQCFTEVYTWTEIAHHMVLMLSVTYFICTFNNWIRTVVHPSEIDKYVVAFGVIQGLGIFFAPFNGMLMDYFRKYYTASLGLRLASFKSVTIQLFINDAIVISMFALSLVPVPELQYVTMFLQSIGRVFLYGTAAAFCATVYPSSRFGLLFGLTGTMGGFSCLLQFPMTLLLTRVFNNNYTVVNGMMMALCCCNLLHPLYLLSIIKTRAAKRNEEQLEGEKAALKV